MSAELKPALTGVFLVPPEFVPAEWPGVYPLLNRAMERSGGRWSMPALLHAMCVADYQLWVVRQDGNLVAAAGTNYAVYPHRRLLAIQFMGGDGFDQWGDDLLSTLERYAQDTGCDGIESVARFGFWPIFKRHGFDKSYCMYDRFFEDK